MCVDPLCDSYLPNSSKRCRLEEKSNVFQGQRWLFLYTCRFCCGPLWLPVRECTSFCNRNRACFGIESVFGTIPQDTTLPEVLYL